jgi:signal transduction histidine kinase
VNGQAKHESPLTFRRWHLLVYAGLLFGAYWLIEQRYVTERRELVLEQDDIAQALARAYLEDHGSIGEHEGALYAGGYRINWSDTLVDSVKADSHCGVAIYQGDEIIATTLAAPGASERAVGVKATPDVKALVLQGGHDFRGRMQLLGQERLVVFTPLKAGDDHVVGMLATYRDVHDLGFAIGYFRAMLGGVMAVLYLAMVALLVRMARQARERAAERRALIEERAKQHAKFFESMTQELRTPLSTLLVFASSLVDSVADDRSREVARRVQGETKDLLGVVDDILDYARIEAGNLALAVEEVDLAKIVEACVEGARARAGTRAIKLDVQLPGDLPKANGDPARVQQAITNLLSAAIQATDEGRVKVRGASDRDVVTIDVSDNGLALSEPQLATIWDPFHVAAATGRAQAGSGLALSITRGLVTRMGGSVEARSRSGKGTTLRIGLPRATVTV